MKKTFGKTDLEFVFFQEFWQFYKNYAIPEYNDGYWKSVVEESTKINDKYKNTEIHILVRGILMETLKYLENVSMRERG